MKISFRKKKKKLSKIPLNSFELFVLRESMPHLSSYGVVHYDEAVEKVYMDLDSNSQTDFRMNFKGTEVEKILCYLVEAGYCRFDDVYHNHVIKEVDCPIGFIDRRLECKLVFLTEKGRWLKDKAIYLNRHNKKIVSLIFKFRYKLFYAKYILPVKTGINKLISRFKKKKK